MVDYRGLLGTEDGLLLSGVALEYLRRGTLQYVLREDAPQQYPSGGIVGTGGRNPSRRKRMFLDARWLRMLEERRG